MAGVPGGGAAGSIAALAAGAAVAIVVVTADGAHPPAPEGLTATADGRSRIELSWNVPEAEGDEEGGGESTTAPVKGYRVEWSADGADDSWDELASVDEDETGYGDAGLEPGTTRYYRVIALSNAGESPASNTAAATTARAPPTAPSGLSAAANGRTAVDLSWTAPTAEATRATVTGYRIEWSADGTDGSWATLVANQAATTYSDTGLEPATTRHYRIVALGASGESPPSDSAAATTDDSLAPLAPAGLSAVADGQRAIGLTWAAPAADSTRADVTGYRIEWSETGEDGSWTTLVASQAGTSYSNSGLTPGSTRHYRVIALSAAGESPASSSASATTGPLLPPLAPAGLSAAADGQRAIGLAWTAPTADATRAAVIGYRIEWSADGTDGSWATLVANQAATTYSHTGLEPGTTRHYRVVALSAAGESAASDSAGATTDPLLPPLAPTDLSAAADGQTIDLAWTASEAGDARGEVTGYRVEWSADGSDGSWTTLAASRAGTGYEHTGLEPGTTRHYRVIALSDAGESPPSNSANATTNLLPPLAPTDLSAAADGFSAIDLEWTASEADATRAAVTGYRIERSADGTSGSWSTLVTLAAGAAAYRDSGLDPVVTRHYRVVALSDGGDSPPSNTDFATTERAPPLAPTGLGAIAEGRSAINLSWTAPVAADTRAAVTGYRVEWSADGVTGWAVLVTGRTETSYGDTGLEAGATRHYRVVALSDRGDSPPSGSAFAVTAGAIEGEVTPLAPGSLGAAAQGRTVINLEWTAPEADDARDEVTGYRVEWSADGADDSWAELVTLGAEATGHSHTGLQPGTTRHYRVFALSEAGESPPSNIARAKTGFAPENLTATANGPNAIDLSWTTAGSAAGVTGHRVEWSADGADGSWAELVTLGADAAAHSHTGLEPGTTRHYRVFALSEAGDSQASNTASATTDFAPPVAPGNLRLVADGTSAINLSWTAPEADASRAAVTGYRVEWSDTGLGRSWLTLDTVDASATAYSDGGLPPGTERHYRVFALSEAGDSPPSNTANATTFAQPPEQISDPPVTPPPPVTPDPPAGLDPPLAPAGLSATANGQTAINLSWTAPAADSTRAAVTGYHIEWSADGTSGSWATLVASQAGTTYSNTGLTAGTTRYYRVFALSGAGESPASNTESATTAGLDPPLAPVGLSATANGQTAIDLSWSAPAADSTRAAVTGYHIEWSADGTSGSWATLVASQAGTTYSHTGLTAGTTRYYRVFALSGAGPSPASNTDNATTAPLLAPSAPSGLSATASGQTAINLSWTAPAADSTRAAVTGYRIQSSADGNAWTDLVPSQATTSYSHTGLTAGTTRHYRVFALSEAGDSQASNTASATTDFAPPLAPSSLTATAGGTTSISLSWTAPTADSTRAAVTGYRIERSATGADGTWMNLESSHTGTSYTHTNLAPATTQHYRVFALSSAGDSPASNTASATTTGGG